MIKKILLLGTICISLLQAKEVTSTPPPSFRVELHPLTMYFLHRAQISAELPVAPQVSATVDLAFGPALGIIYTDSTASPDSENSAWYNAGRLGARYYFKPGLKGTFVALHGAYVHINPEAISPLAWEMNSSDTTLTLTSISGYASFGAGIGFVREWSMGNRGRFHLGMELTYDHPLAIQRQAYIREDMNTEDQFFNILLGPLFSTVNSAFLPYQSFGLATWIGFGF